MSYLMWQEIDQRMGGRNLAGAHQDVDLSSTSGSGTKQRSDRLRSVEVLLASPLSKTFHIGNFVNLMATFFIPTLVHSAP